MDEAAATKKLERIWWFPKMLAPCRYKAVDGGRGGAKSWSFAQAAIHLGCQKPLFIVCAREIQESIKDSVKKLLEDEIKRMGLVERFRITHEEIRADNGTRFVFKGLRYNPEATKSLEGCDICWVEEARALSEASLELLLPTVRREGSEVWFSWNEGGTVCPVGERFPLHESGDNVMRMRVNYYDNPRLPSVLAEEARFCRVNFPARYRRIWLGEPGHIEYQIFRPEWWPQYASLAEVEARVTFKFITGDTAFETGQENDYSAFQCWGCEGSDRMYLLDEVYGKWEYPELVRNARNFWKKHSDASAGRPAQVFYVEKKASGHSLVQTLKREKINARGWLPKAFKFPDNKIAGYKEVSWLLAPDPDSGETTGDTIWVPSHSVNPSAATIIDHCAAISEDDSHEHDDRADALRMAVSVFRKRGGGKKY